MDDWRLLRGQEKYLARAKLVYHMYEPRNPSNDHDHCEFCMRKFDFSPGCEHIGYSTIDNELWICCECFEDFKDTFKWDIKSS